MQNVDYTDIINCVKKNEVQALGQLYDGLNKLVYNKCLFILKDSELAKDATHDVFLKAFQKIDQITDPKKIEGWISRIVYNHCIDYFRSQKKLNDETEEFGYSLEKQDILTWDKDDDLHTNTKILKQEIEKLNDTERLILVLYYWEEMSVNEIAESLNIGLSSTKMKLLRTRTKLRDNIENSRSFKLIVLLLANSFYNS
mgnify:CR=1 FL=1